MNLRPNMQSMPVVLMRSTGFSVRTSLCAGASLPLPRVSVRRCRSWPQRQSSVRPLSVKASRVQTQSHFISMCCSGKHLTVSRVWFEGCASCGSGRVLLEPCCCASGFDLCGPERWPLSQTVPPLPLSRWALKLQQHHCNTNTRYKHSHTLERSSRTTASPTSMRLWLLWSAVVLHRTARCFSLPETAFIRFES